jgi:chromosome segregation ATPase
MRQSWTDDRLDDLSHRMDERFDRVEGEIKAQGKELRGEIAGVEARLRSQASEHYARTGEELAKVREEFATVHSDKQELLAEMHALQRTLVRIAWTGVTALIAAFAGALIAHI